MELTVFNKYHISFFNFKNILIDFHHARSFNKIIYFFLSSMSWDSGA